MFSDKEIEALVRNIKWSIGNEIMREAHRSGEYSKHGVRHSVRSRQSSAPYESFARQTGTLSDSIEVKVNEDLIMVGSNVEYLKFLEEGTKFMKKRPTLDLAFRKTDINGIIKEKFDRFFR